MIVSAHQPNFVPWLGFFDKMAQSDVTVLLDSVQFIKRGYQNRARVKGPSGAQWLTVPVVTKGRYDQLTHHVEIDETQDWRQVHRRTLHGLLARTPHRDLVDELLEPVYGEGSPAMLAELNIALIREVAARLEIDTRIVLLSELDAPGSSSQLMLNLTRAAGGDVYLSGPTGRKYLEPGMFETAGIELRYHSFTPFEYAQPFGEFLPGLSCLDYVANVGFRSWRNQREDGKALTPAS
ncbi:WbqC family protein [Actinomycetospora rhizophila]|uniref:WbqC family protein n=1 Tax=Actinomycetospora rhizophila TaxID=1416876 RepID=A0ABV9ZKX0_9PSEU